jgi:hypothetical protein
MTAAGVVVDHSDVRDGAQIGGEYEYLNSWSKNKERARRSATYARTTNGTIN